MVDLFDAVLQCLTQQSARPLNVLSIVCRTPRGAVNVDMLPVERHRLRFQRVGDVSVQHAHNFVVPVGNSKTHEADSAIEPVRYTPLKGAAYNHYDSTSIRRDSTVERPSNRTRIVVVIIP